MEVCCRRLQYDKILYFWHQQVPPASVYWLQSSNIALHPTPAV
jgi:hypothetical protein